MQLDALTTNEDLEIRYKLNVPFNHLSLNSYNYVLQFDTNSFLITRPGKTTILIIGNAPMAARMNTVFCFIINIYSNNYSFMDLIKALFCNLHLW